MRKPRDFDAELRALEHKVMSLKERRVRQLGELVAATGADALDAETLAGGLLAMIGSERSGQKGELAQARPGVLSAAATRGCARRSKP